MEGMEMEQEEDFESCEENTGVRCTEIRRV